MKHIIFTFFIILILNGCAATSDIGVKPTRISSSIKASQYNEFAVKYLERPTWVSYAEYKTIPNRLYLQFTEYGGGNSGKLYFMQDRVDKYLALLDKYFEWEFKATKRGDILELKELGYVDLISGVKNKFSFYSGNSTQHSLVIEDGLLGQYESAMIFDKTNVQELKNLFNDFKDGKITISKDSIYN